MRELISVTREDNKEEKTIIDAVTVKDPAVDLAPLARTESRVFLLYATQIEAVEIMATASKLGLTRKTYVWIAAQAVIGPSLEAPDEFPVGMLGVHFKTGKSNFESSFWSFQKRWG